MEKVIFAIFETLANDDPAGQEAWLTAQITATWTAFEAMAGDLWEAALNCKPAELAKLSGTKQNGDSRNIDINFIHKYNYNISNRMGTIFVETNKYKFDSLRGIRQAYKDAFGGCLDYLIDDTALDALSIVRNNLIHSGGIIDEKYRRRSSILPLEAVGEAGSHIPLEGELATKLINPVLKLGNALLIAVDSWLTAH
ncbi:MAG: hypothetical protein WA733_06670 [Methylocystis sp.]